MKLQPRLEMERLTLLLGQVKPLARVTVSTLGSLSILLLENKQHRTKAVRAFAFRKSARNPLSWRINCLKITWFLQMVFGILLPNLQPALEESHGFLISRANFLHYFICCLINFIIRSIIANFVPSTCPFKLH